MTREFEIDDGKFYYLDKTKTATGEWKRVSSKTFTLGGTEKIAGVKQTVTEANINITGDSTTLNQVKIKQSGNNVVVYVYKIKDGMVSNTVLGKITLKNLGSKTTVEHQNDYTASLTTAYGTEHPGSINIENFFAYEYHKEYTNIDKAVSLKGTYLNETFLGGNKNDTIKGVGGTNDITGGKGYDKMYGGENDDTFNIAQGDAKLKRVESKDGSLKKYTGTGDVIYSTNQIDALRLGFDKDPAKTTFTSDNKKNLIIESRYIEDGKVQMDKVTVNKYFAVASDERIKIEDANGDAFPVSMLIEGSGKIDGTDLGDTIIGSNKVDTITTYDGNDTITANKANDSIIINGIGTKTIIMNDGDGSDTVSVSGIDKAEDVILIMNDSTGGHATTFTYAKNYQDLVITALNETLTLKNFFDVKVPDNHFTGKSGDFSNVYLNGELVDISSGADKITIGGVKVSKLLDDLTWGDSGQSVAKWLKTNGYSIPSAISNANVFIGTKYSDSFTGTTGRDIMISTDGGNTLGEENEYTTGTGGQTGIAALGESNDIVNVSAFSKTGTGLYDEDGVYSLNISGADSNDMHMIKTDLDFLIAYNKGSFNAKKILGHDIENYQGLTTTDGLTKIANIDLRKIGAQLKTIYDNGLATEASVKAINTLLSLTPSALDNMKGVSVITGNEDFDFQDINLTDKNEVISKESQAAIQTKTSEALNNFMAETALKYDLILDSKAALANVLFGLSEQSKKLSNSEYNEIKKGFFDMFKTLYVGTSGDNSYTFKKADYTAVASGEGSDTFTFSGEIGAKVNNDEEKGAQYDIISTVKEGQSDTIEFTDLTIGDDLTTNGLDIEGHIVKGANFEEFKSDEKSMTKANVSYSLGENGEGFDFTNQDFYMTVQDKVRTYDVTAQYRAVGELEPEWETDSNNIAYLYGDDIDVDSTSGYNAIFANTDNTIPNHAEFEYEYADGHDIVDSKGKSNGEYNVALSNKTELSIKDYGEGDNDTLALDNQKNEIKLFFNIHADGSTDIGQEEQSAIGTFENGYDFVYATELTKSNFDITKTTLGSYALLKNSANVNLNLSGAECGIEQVSCGDGDIEINIDCQSIIGKIKEDVANWFNDNQAKGYADVYDVVARGSSEDVAIVLGYYNDAYNQYTAQA